MHIDYIRLYDTFDFAQRRLPVLRLQGQEPGAVIWLTANAHGDEVNGIEVIHRVFEQLKNSGGLQRGTLYAMPTLNPMAFEVIQRNIPLTNENLNRFYPGAAHGTFAERHAHTIYDTIIKTKPDLVIDLHTMNCSRTPPFIILDRFTDESQPEISRRLKQVAEMFGITVVYDFEMSLYKKLRLDSSLSGAMLNHGKVLSFTVELGAHRIVTETMVEAGVQGVFNLLREYQLIADDGTRWRDPSMLPTDIPLRRDPDVRANTAGLLRYLVRVGQWVEAGAALAQVKNLTGDVIETIKATEPGYVLYLDEIGSVVPGMEIMGLAVHDAAAPVPAHNL